MKILKEFKEFAVKGNVVDMAVGVVVGGAFSKIVTSLVSDIITPFFSILLGKANLSSLVLQVGEATINYGMFLQNVVDFLIISASIFAVIRIINKFKRKQEPAPAEAPEPTQTELLLMEIRDELKKR